MAQIEEARIVPVLVVAAVAVGWTAASNCISQRSHQRT